MIPPAVLSRLATLGLDTRLAETFAEMLRAVEEATRAETSVAIISAREKNAARQARYRASRNVTKRDEKPPEPRVRAFFTGEEEVIDPPRLPSVAIPPSEKPESAKPKRAKARTPIAPDAQPTDRDRAAAVEAGLVNGHFREQWQKFRDYHLSRGSLMADWSAAWRTWTSNISQFSGSSRHSSGGDKSHSVGAALERLQAKFELEQTLQFDLGPSPLLTNGRGH
jgi:hypothetical protein